MDVNSRILTPSLPEATGSARQPQKAPGVRDAEAWETAKEFETQFMSIMLEQAQAGVGEDGAFDSGFASDTWHDMFVEQQAKAVTEAGGVGIAEQVYKDLVDGQ